MKNTIVIHQTYPNQKLVVTKKAQSDAEHTYGIFNIEAAFTAAQVLSDRAFKLYVRMNLHQDGFAYALSPVELKNSIGMSDTRYRQAVKELIEKGYLVQSSERKNLYTFCESLDREPSSTETPASYSECIQEESMRCYSCPSDTRREIIDNNKKNSTSNTTGNSTSNNMSSDYLSVLDDVANYIGSYIK